jgi:hypothetical protein
MLRDPTHHHSKGTTVPFIVFQYILGIALQITEEAHCPEKTQMPIILDERAHSVFHK